MHHPFLLVQVQIYQVPFFCAKSIATRTLPGRGRGVLVCRARSSAAGGPVMIWLPEARGGAVHYHQEAGWPAASAGWPAASAGWPAASAGQTHGKRKARARHAQGKRKASARQA